MRRVERITEFDSQPFFGPFEGLAFDSPFDFNRFTGTNGRVAATWSLFNGAFVQRLAASRYDEKRNDDDVVFGFFRSHGERDNFDYKGTADAPDQCVRRRAPHADRSRPIVRRNS